MIYADYEFYTSEYLCGKAVVIDSTAFSFYVREASAIIKQHTFDNIKEDIIDEVKLCCCELAELIYTYKTNAVKNGGVSSETVGGWSKSYESSESKGKQYQKDIKDIIRKWLLSTGLLYRGV